MSSKTQSAIKNHTVHFYNLPSRPNNLNIHKARKDCHARTSTMSIPHNSASAQRVYVAFEGGGAKGIVHVGALKAMEEHNFEYRGLAGTSAGAIVASLKAVGYTSDEIVNVEHRTNILHELPLKKNGRRHGPKDLFGPLGWTRIQLLVRGSKLLLKKENIFYIWCTVFFITAICLTLYVGKLSSLIAPFLAVCFVVMLIIALSSFLILKKLAAGLNKLESFKHSLNHLLGKKVNPLEPDKPVLLKDFGVNGRPSLKIVASDICRKELRLFSSDSAADRDLSVADVVAASICLPIIFQPHRLQNSIFLDGGITSNLPIWPFDTERALDPDALTIGVTINPKGEEISSVPSVNLRSVIETALFGASVLNARAIEGLVNISIDTKMNTLDFDADFSRVSSEIEASAQVCRVQIYQEIFGLPALYREGTSDVREVVTEFLNATAMQKCLNQYRVRVALAMKSDESATALKIKYCSGYDNDIDDGILLPIIGSVVGQSWMLGKTIIKQAPLDPDCDLSDARSRRVRKLVAADLTWFVAVPIFELDSFHSQNRPAFVVAIDGTGFFDNLYDPNWIASEISENVQAIFKPIVEAIKDLKDAKTNASRWI